MTASDTLQPLGNTQYVVSMKILSKVLIATILAGIAFSPVYLYSGAPLRVHLADALGLLIAFWIPALMIRSWEDLKRRALLFAAFVVFGTLAWDAVTASVISKRDFLMGAAILYPVSLIGCFALFSIQAALLKLFKQETV
ncbi:MAG: hypothetical protein QNJ19_16060 [Woeseiaceae bacterium]|nr:hypothetical protein [Woeseiaceae bacterium]